MELDSSYIILPPDITKDCQIKSGYNKELQENKQFPQTPFTCHSKRIILFSFLLLLLQEKNKNAFNKPSYNPKLIHIRVRSVN